MCDGFNHGALQIAVAQICQSMGWDALQKSSHDLLTDVLQKYLEEIAKSAHGYSQICEFGRSVLFHNKVHTIYRMLIDAMCTRRN